MEHRGLFVSIAAFCPRCGEPNPRGYPFCAKCGGSLSMQAAAPGSSTFPAQAPAYPTAGPSLQGPWQTTQTPWSPYPPGVLPMKPATAEAMISDTFHVFGKDILVYIGLFLLYAVLITSLTLVLTQFAIGYASGTVTPSPDWGIAITMDVLIRVILLTLVVAIMAP